MHTPVLFEHPLNEKMRTWLRIEFLIQQMAFRPQIASHADALHFFRNAGDLLDVLERGEVRTDLVKELERQQRKLQSWAEVPGVDQERINELRHQLKQSSSTLMAAPRIGQFLREDRLIALVRQRLSIPGGCCSFDLPTLHIWLHMPQAHRDEQVASWLASLDPLVQSLSLILDLIRNSAPLFVLSDLSSDGRGTVCTFCRSRTGTDRYGPLYVRRFAPPDPGLRLHHRSDG